MHIWHLQLLLVVAGNTYS